MKEFQNIKKLVFIIVLVVILCPKSVFAELYQSTGAILGSTTHEKEKNNQCKDSQGNVKEVYQKACADYLGINITAAPYVRTTNQSTDTVSARNIKITCTGRCKAYMYYSDYGTLEGILAQEIYDEDENKEDSNLQTKTVTFNDTYEGWSVSAGKEALIVVVSLNEKVCNKYNNQNECTEWKYPQKVPKDSSGNDVTCPVSYKVCTARDSSGKCTKTKTEVEKVAITCNKGKFESDLSEVLEVQNIEIKGNGASLFIQNPADTYYVENLRYRENQDFGEACKKAYNGIYDGKESKVKKYSVSESELEDYQTNYYNKILGSYCDSQYVPFNLKPSKIKSISNNLLRVYYNRRKMLATSSKDINEISTTIQNLEADIKLNYGDNHIIIDNQDLTQNLSCKKDAYEKTKEEYLYKEEKSITVDLSTGDNLPVCKTLCYEHLTVKYDPPAVVKAGLCFSYKVTIKSEAECGIKDEFDIDRVKVRELCAPVPICENSNGHTQAGPSEEFDSCIQKCDAGKYTQSCINKCYQKVYQTNNKNTIAKSNSKTNENIKENNNLMLNMDLKQKNDKVQFLADESYDENDLKLYYQENNNEKCNTEKIISYVHNGNTTELEECAEYYFQAKTLWPYGYYGNDGTRWKQYTENNPITNAGATSKETKNIPMQIARSAPFYLRSVKEVTNLLKDLVVPKEKTGKWRKYNIDENGVKRQYSSRWICNQSCSFTPSGCPENPAFTSNQFSEDTIKDLDALSDALSKCSASSACDTSIEEEMTTFEIKINAQRQNGEAVDDLKPSEGTTKLHQTMGFGNDLNGDGNADMFVPEEKNGTGTGILGLCYDGSNYPHYQTTITYPGTWINYKNGKRIYTTLHDDSYFYRENSYCTTYDIQNVNVDYFKWALNDNYNLSSSYIQNFQPLYNITSQLGKQNKGFGKYNWKINFQCFYASYNCLPDSESCPPDPEISCNSENSTTLCNSKFRVVDSSILFPDETGNKIEDESKISFNWTSAAQDKVATESSVASHGYGIDPGEYRVQVEQNSASAFDSNGKKAYHIYLTKENINAIKSYTKANGYTSYPGTYTQVEGMKGLYYYTSSILTDPTKVKEFDRDARLGYNNK